METSQEKKRRQNREAQQRRRDKCKRCLDLRMLRKMKGMKGKGVSFPSGESEKMMKEYEEYTQLIGGAKKGQPNFRARKSRDGVPEWPWGFSNVREGRDWDALAKAEKNPKEFYSNYEEFFPPTHRLLDTVQFYWRGGEAGRKRIIDNMEWLGFFDLAKWWGKRYDAIEETVRRKYIKEYLLLLGYNGIPQSWKHDEGVSELTENVEGAKYPPLTYQDPPLDEYKWLLENDIPLQFIDPRNSKEVKLRNGKIAVERLRKGLDPIPEPEEPKPKKHKRLPEESTPPERREEIRSNVDSRGIPKFTEPRGYSFVGQKNKGKSPLELWDALKEAEEDPEEFYNGDPLQRLEEIDKWNLRAFAMDVNDVSRAMDDAFEDRSITDWWKKKITELDRKTRRKYIEEYLLLLGYSAVPTSLEIDTNRIGTVPALKKASSNLDSGPLRAIDPRNSEEVKLRNGKIAISKIRNKRKADRDRQARNRKECNECLAEMKKFNF